VAISGHHWEDHILNVASLTGIVLGGGLEREGVLRETPSDIRRALALHAKDELGHDVG
jgi:hypothetical protein